MLDFGCWLNPAAAHKSTNIQHPKSNIYFSNIYVKDSAAALALFVAIPRRLRGGFPGAPAQGPFRRFSAAGYSRGCLPVFFRRSRGAELALLPFSVLRRAAAAGISLLDP